MTKKNYERAALLVQEVYRESYAKAVPVEDTFVRFFAEDNPRFDAERFRRACAPGANVRARG